MSLVEQSHAAGGHVGRSLRRKEDPRLITGRATYVDDMTLPGMLHAVLVRSPEAHAKIVSIDKSAAEARDDVVAVFTGEDLADLASALPCAWAPEGVELRQVEHWPLARGEVKHVGDPVAVVLCEDRGRAFDAAEDVFVEYEPLPAVVDARASLQEGSPLVHESLGTNESHVWSLGGGDLEGGFAKADVIVERTVENHRVSGAPIEPRGLVADYRAGHLTIHTSTQVPHFVRLFLGLMLGMSEERIRVVAPEVGGGFGAKLQMTGEEALLAWVSRKLQRPVKWIETRSEHMAVCHHGRAQTAECKMGVTNDGKITAFHVEITQDLGAYLMLLTPTIPSLGAFVMNGVYDMPAVQTDIRGAYTNTCATDAIRGAGRPEATHLIEVMMDQVAAELGMDRLELRRKNFIPKENFPAETAIGIVYDSGDYHASLDKLLTHVDIAEVEASKAALREKGILRGIGFSTYTEICGLAPSRITGPAGFGLQTGLWESAIVRVTVTGAVTVYTGTSPHGQGHETTMAQVVADQLGVDPENVEILHGDTGTGAMGLGTYGSRSTAVGTESISRAAEKVAKKVREIVAHTLEASADDIVVQDGKFVVKGSPDKGMALADVAGMAHVRPELLPEGMEPALEETSFYDPANFVFPFGAHACIVDVEEDTGKVKVVRHIAVDDCGPAINPMLIDGQVHGGIAQAIGQALYEHVAYDEDGQLVTGTFVDYALPTAAELPSFETDRTETPSPVNTLGVKGIGEAGTIAATPAVLNAVVDALRPTGVTYLNMPLFPERIWRAMTDAKGGAA